MRFVQDGVFKCNAPPSDEPGFVRLTILRNGESITLDSDVNVVNEFEYRGQFTTMQKKRDKKVKNNRARDKDDRTSLNELVSGG